MGLVSCSLNFNPLNQTVGGHVELVETLAMASSLLTFPQILNQVQDDWLSRALISIIQLHCGSSC